MFSRNNYTLLAILFLLVFSSAVAGMEASTESVKRSNIAVYPLRINLDGVSISAPKSLKLGESGQVRLVLEPGENQFVVEAKLNSFEFNSISITPVKQVVLPGQSTSWAWEIKPTKSGLQSLIITISTFIDIDGKEVTRVLRTYSQQVEVSVTSSQLFLQFLSENWSWFFSGIIVIGFLLILVKGQASFRSRVKLQEQKILKIKDIEKDKLTLESDPELLEYIESEIALVIEREKLVMMSSHERSNALYTLGTLFMVLSVFAPISSIALYVTLDPISTSTLSILNEFTKIGINLDSKKLSVVRDWRILAGGISFGLIFLAAARGLVAQESRMRAMYLHFKSRISDYENLLTALKISDKTCKITDDNKVNEMLGVVISKLVLPSDFKGLTSLSDENNEGVIGQNVYENLKKLTEFK